MEKERFLIDRGANAARASRTSWGEESYIRIDAMRSSGAFSLLDFRAPAGFGPVRHIHHREDEVLHLVEGRIAIWTPDRESTMAPGDLVSCRRESPMPGRFTAMSRCA